MILAKKMRPETKISPLASLSFVLVIAGIVLGENELVGYTLIGLGLVIAFVDIFKKSKK
jgi:hypothetical protein